MAKTIYVRLVVDADPQVQVDPIVLGKSELKWRRDGESVDFDFVSITDLPPDVFRVDRVTKKKINVTNRLEVGRYPYTITVKSNGSEYTTSQSGPPADGGKPVIRN